MTRNMFKFSTYSHLCEKVRNKSFEEFFQILKMKMMMKTPKLQQVGTIKRKVWNFTEEVMNFRQNFHDEAPFNYEVGGL